MSLDAGKVNQKEYGDNAADAHGDTEGGSYSGTSADQVMRPPVPQLDVSIATPTPGEQPNFGFNPKDEKMGFEDKDVNPPDDTANVNHDPGSGDGGGTAAFPLALLLRRLPLRVGGGSMEPRPAGGGALDAVAIVSTGGTTTCVDGAARAGGAPSCGSSGGGDVLLPR
jgi:hypothetical protein